MKETTGSDVADGSIVFKLKWNELGVVDKVQANLLKSDGSNLDDGSFKNVDLTVFPAQDKSYEYVKFKTADDSHLSSGYYILKLELQQNIGDESVADYKAGHDRAIKYLMGQVMKETKGSVNPKMAMDILTEKSSGNGEETGFGNGI